MIKVIKRPARSAAQPIAHEIDEAQVLAELQDFKARSARLRDMRAELLEKYPDQYVALTGNGVLVVAASREERVAKIKALGEQPGLAAREFLNTKPRPRRIPG